MPLKNDFHPFSSFVNDSKTRQWLLKRSPSFKIQNDDLGPGHKPWSGSQSYLCHI